MILGVMSDTHGNLPLMFRAADLLRDRFGASVLAHLGDDWEDAEALAAAAPEVWAVPGLWCDAFRDWRIPNARRETADGLIVAMAHDEGTLARESAGAHLLLSGHTHTARIAADGGALRINPGHLRAPRDRGQPASFAVVDLRPDRVVCTICGLDGATLLRGGLPREALTGAKPRA
ncbi:MAG TPA: metallophosphoesterase family protein [Candidatus Hydrogenedentes bacterium]|jgi:putative phosphoesterase|nr:metallophosphoesterase family protein [Candidatus Hydrogenedentota bacterium]HOC73810.1 metallophosphoesterase family protein [Candidatus Hydrogenedentota bacterium]HPA41988.1 metallophosphoesterase family protein [Candidatus Hydrogenedentota bacterium]HQL94499.1 metallophosphoesterase family protein [Candidatus Hydrogenedentota bacterium]